MKKISLAVSILALALGACASTRNTTVTPGAMSDAGIIGPCRGDSRDIQACGNAIFNASVISQVHAGQTLMEVRSIMRHDAERHEVAGKNVSWGYITSYENKMLTWITFTDRKVSSLSHEEWLRD